MGCGSSMNPKQQGNIREPEQGTKLVIVQLENGKEFKIMIKQEECLLYIKLQLELIIGTSWENQYLYLKEDLNTELNDKLLIKDVQYKTGFILKTNLTPTGNNINNNNNNNNQSTYASPTKPNGQMLMVKNADNQSETQEISLNTANFQNFIQQQQSNLKDQQQKQYLNPQSQQQTNMPNSASSKYYEINDNQNDDNQDNIENNENQSDNSENQHTIKKDNSEAVFQNENESDEQEKQQLQGIFVQIHQKLVFIQISDIETETLYEIKQKLHKMEGIQPEAQKFIFQGEILHDEQNFRLTEYNLKNGDTISCDYYLQLKPPKNNQARPGSNASSQQQQQQDSVFLN